MVLGRRKVLSPGGWGSGLYIEDWEVSAAWGSGEGLRSWPVLSTQLQTSVHSLARGTAWVQARGSWKNREVLPWGH